MDKKMKLDVGGKSIGLNFGANWFIEHFKRTTGHDLIKESLVEVVDFGSVQFFEYIRNMIWAAYLAECSVRRLEPELQMSDVEAFVMDTDEQGAIDIFYSVTACRLGMGVDEFKAMSNGTEEKKNQNPA